MQSPLKSIKARVRELRPYSLGPERASVKINQNENPWDAPLRIKAETMRRLNQRPWSRYPEFDGVSLREKLAAFTGWGFEGIVAGNGSNELIQALLMVTVGEGTRVLISEPTFALYRQVTNVLSGDIISVPLTPDLQYDGDALKKAMAAYHPEVTIICSPNNPTGARMRDCDLRSLLEMSGGLVAVDEAYFEFGEGSVVPLLQSHKNLLVLRTFSKAMAMAGLRVGYLLAWPELALEIRKAILPYNLNIVSHTAAEVAVEMYESEIHPLVQQIRAERERLFQELQRIKGLTPISSQANFMLVRSSISPRDVFSMLLERDILIRDVSRQPLLEQYFRISVGTPDENDRLVKALHEIYV